MAASNLTPRTAPKSSTSTPSSKISGNGIQKKFACIHPNCGKSFSRSEHLHRHALNHKDGNHTCLRCSAHFRRRDLLDRHMARHKEKDDEAGGEGLGVLATRKRLWRDAEGNIVNARRPSFTQDGNKRRMIGRPVERKSSQSSLSVRKLSTNPQPILASTSLPSPPVHMSRVGSAHSTIVVDTTQSPYGELQDEQRQRREEVDERDLQQDPPSWLSPSLPSPPHSSSSSFSSSSGAQSPSAELDTLYEDTNTWPITHDGLPQILNNTPILGRQSEYPPSPSWGGSGPQQSFQTFMGAVGEFEEPQPKDEYADSGLGIYGWQNPWGLGGGSSQMMLSRVREEKFDASTSQQQKYDSQGIWQDRTSSVFPAQEVMRRGFMGAC